MALHRSKDDKGNISEDRNEEEAKASSDSKGAMKECTDTSIQKEEETHDESKTPHSSDEEDEDRKLPAKEQNPTTQQQHVAASASSETALISNQQLPPECDSPSLDQKHTAASMPAEAAPVEGKNETPHDLQQQHAAATSSTHVVNPYLKKYKSDAAARAQPNEELQQPQKNTQYPSMFGTSSGPSPKRNPPNPLLLTSKKQREDSREVDRIKLLVEGYAFHDDIVGVAHRKSTDEDAFNLPLRNMIYGRELEEDGFSYFAALRDLSSGKEDEPLKNDSGYHQYLFLSVNVHHFADVTEAHNAVITQCQKLQAVRTQFLFPFPFLPSRQVRFFSLTHTHICTSLGCR